jgi:hypothetical protein
LEALQFSSGDLSVVLQGADFLPVVVGKESGHVDAAQLNVLNGLNSCVVAIMKIVVHADWGSEPKKRWMCVADSGGDQKFATLAPELVGDPATLLRRLLQRGDGRVFVGFDFPIGVPAAYARRLGVTRFPELLRAVGTDALLRFFELADNAAEITPSRPFYPKRSDCGAKRQHLIDGLGVAEYIQLLRRCELRTATRGDACSLFWTLGGQQVGRAAIIGWRDVLRPALLDAAMDVALWPFDGDLEVLLNRHQIVIAETYPAEAAVHIGMGPPGRGWSKRLQADRVRKSPAIRQFAQRAGITLAPELDATMSDGFGASKDGEDPFDAVIGLVSMIAVMKRLRPAGTPPPGTIRNVEGWILGQEFPRS